jgi:hypothetical protein
MESPMAAMLLGSGGALDARADQAPIANNSPTNPTKTSTLRIAATCFPSHSYTPQRAATPLPREHARSVPKQLTAVNGRPARDPGVQAAGLPLPGAGQPRRHDRPALRNTLRCRRVTVETDLAQPRELDGEVIDPGRHRAAVPLAGDALTMLEALAAGRPAAGAAIPGIAESLPDTGGAVVPGEGISALAEDHHTRVDRPDVARARALPGRATPRPAPVSGEPRAPSPRSPLVLAGGRE